MDKYTEFLGPNNCEYAQADFVIVPIPFEGNISWVGGASKGPSAIIRASYELEYYDYEIGFNLNTIKHYTVNPIADYDSIGDAIKNILNDSKFPITLGGDHSISIPIFRQLPNEVSILHIDAHFDMRRSYMGNVVSHACALYEASKNHNVVHTAVRSGCEEDLYNVNQFGNHVCSIHNISEIMKHLNEDVYITFDVDAFDPSLIPATGTPEPGGITWNDANALLERVCKSKNVIGADFVELAPLKGMHSCESTVAKLIARCMAYSHQT